MAAERLTISMACGDYDRTRALREGSIEPEGASVDYVSLPSTEIFYRQAKFREWDVSEMSLGTYMILSSRGDNPFVAIPVFPSRHFRHGALWVNSNSGIDGPTDLRGRRVGIPNYHMTAAIWIRGILHDEHGVDPKEILWTLGGLNAPGFKDRIDFEPEPGLHIKFADEGRTLDQMLAAGELDALVATLPPKSFLDGSPAVRRLFDDHRQEEREYFRRTRRFPIMHCVALKRDVNENHPWLALSLFGAFVAAKRMCLDRLTAPGPLPVTLPWLPEYVADLQQLLGEDYWPYGVERNRDNLSTLARYCFEQGLLDRPVSVDELFAATTLSAVE